jgi:anion-transporting  ArsA/GET3 family ATPase
VSTAASAGDAASAKPGRRPRVAAGPSGLFDRPLVVVTGKGGVGKSTVAAALGLAAAGRGLRTIIAEVARRDDVSRVLGGTGVHEDELAPNLHHISIDPQDAMEEYLVDQLPSRALADVLVSSRAFAYFAAATPGLRELLSVGKVWELAQADRRTPGARSYDLVVLDAPATGHSVGVLAAPRTFADTALVGRIARQGRMIDAMLSDPAQTAVVAVASPEETPVNETLALQQALPHAVGLELGLIVANGVLPDRFDTAEAGALQDAPPVPPVRAALTAHARARAQRAQLARLRRGARAGGVRVVTLPFVSAPMLDATRIEPLVRALERVL